MSSATITTSARLMNSTPQTEEQAMVRKVAVSSFLGNFIEWFDYASYSYFATTIALVFFPTDNHTVAMLQTFGVFALSFILRPIGALFWGSYGDKKGRKAALAHSIMFMSGASFLIGCLPSYSVIGVGAPILLLLLRMVQGFSASGEYAGAATFLGEYAPTSKRGIYCSLIPASTAIGLLAGSTLATLMTANMNSSAMVGWGWRVPFLLSAILLNKLWNRRQSTKFNGTSYITQRAAEAIYTPEGRLRRRSNRCQERHVRPARRVVPQPSQGSDHQLRSLRAERGRLLHRAHLPADLSV